MFVLKHDDIQLPDEKASEAHSFSYTSLVPDGRFRAFGSAASSDPDDHACGSSVFVKDELEVAGGIETLHKYLNYQIVTGTGGIHKRDWLLEVFEESSIKSAVHAFSAKPMCAAINERASMLGWCVTRHAISVPPGRLPLKVFENTKLQEISEDRKR